MSLRLWVTLRTILQLINHQCWRGPCQWKSKWAEKQQWPHKSIASIAFKSCGFQLGHIEPEAVEQKIESAGRFLRVRSGVFLRYTLHSCVQHFGQLRVSRRSTLKNKSNCADSFAQNNSTRTAAPSTHHSPSSLTIQHSSALPMVEYFLITTFLTPFH